VRLAGAGSWSRRRRGVGRRWQFEHRAGIASAERVIEERTRLIEPERFTHESERTPDGEPEVTFAAEGHLFGAGFQVWGVHQDGDDEPGQHHPEHAARPRAEALLFVPIARFIDHGGVPWIGGWSRVSTIAGGGERVGL
jgi:hypothetical protein